MVRKTSDYLSTETVQYWLNGSMMTANYPLAQAREKVDNGSAFVISSQAIGVKN